MRLLFVALAALAPLFAQPQQQLPPGDLPVFKVDTMVLQVDAVVTDRNGGVVKDLEAKDFEIVEKGRTRRVDYCSYVPLAPPETIPASAPRPLLPEEVRRTFVFVVSAPFLRLDIDEIPVETRRGRRAPPRRPAGFAGDAAMAARDAADLIARFLNQHMRPGDLVEILKVDQDAGILAQPTNDKDALLAAVEKLRSDPLGGGAPAVALRLRAPLSRSGSPLDVTSLMQQNLRVVGTVDRALDRIAGLPGRKAIVMATRYTLPNTPAFPEGQTVAAAFAKVAERANQVGVTIHAISLAGMEKSTFAPEGPDSPALAARETGGTVFENNNDFAAAVDHVDELNRGYYLLGYRVEDADRSPERIKVRVRRRGTAVWARSAALSQGVSFSGKTLETASEALAAFSAPVGLRDLPVDLATGPVSPSSNGPGARLKYTLDIDLSGIELAPVATGDKGFVLEVAMGLAGPSGEWVKFDSSTHHFRVLPGRELPKSVKREYDLELARPGYYQIRVLVRDRHSKRAGTAAKFVVFAPPDAKGS